MLTCTRQTGKSVKQIACLPLMSIVKQANRQSVGQQARRQSVAIQAKHYYDGQNIKTYFLKRSGQLLRNEVNATKNNPSNMISNNSAKPSFCFNVQSSP